MAAMRLVIVGGVAGGATAAARARRLNEDAEIIVFERGPEVSFANCGLPYHIGGEIPQRKSLLLQTPAGLKARYNLDVRVHTEVLRIDRAARQVEVRDVQTGRTYTEHYDKLLLAPGAGPILPKLPGIDHPRVFTLRNIPDMDRIKAAVDDEARSAIVVGGGYIGLEMAENLRHRGLDVHLIEMAEQVMPPLDREMVTPIHLALRRNSVDLRLGTAVTEFADADGRVRATLTGGETLTADLAVVSVGVRPETTLAEQAGLRLEERGGIWTDAHMRTSDPDIYAVGDAVAVEDFVTHLRGIIPLAGPANRQARIAADNLFGRDSTFRGTQGTAIVRVFDVVAAMTGASEKTLRRANIPYEKVYVHPAHHVGYYPGAAPMHLKLLFSRPDGRVLGAQITGTEGVDKRIDVLAIAIQAGMTVYDLEQTELAYAPPFGAAKDPVNMAGFVAANVLRGDAEIMHADSLDGTFLLDVRQPEEFAAGHLPGATLVPLPELRSRLDELPRNRPIGVYCQVGLRGYVAARILRHHGFDARNVSGGYKTYCAFHPPNDGRDGPGPGGSGGGSGVECPPHACEQRTDDTGRTIRESRAPRATDSATLPEHTLDVRGQCCPGPIVAVGKTLATLHEGQVLRVLATDAGFSADIDTWCRRTGHEVLANERDNGSYVATIRKGAPQPVVAPAAAAPTAHGKTIIVFSNDLDRVLAAFVIANGAASMGRPVTMFFTFWGLNVLRRDTPPHVAKGILDRMFGWMMPRGAKRLALSKMHMAGVGTALMKHVMRSKNVDSLPALIAQAQAAGVRMVVCTMSMDVMGIHKEELIDGLEYGGVGMYLGAAEESDANLFI